MDSANNINNIYKRNNIISKYDNFKLENLFDQVNKIDKKILESFKNDLLDLKKDKIKEKKFKEFSSEDVGNSDDETEIIYDNSIPFKFSLFEPIKPHNTSIYCENNKIIKGDTLLYVSRIIIQF